MITYSDWVRLYRRFTGVDQDEAEGIGTIWMNQGRAIVLKAIGSYITEDTFTADTVNGQQQYILPIRTNKLSNVSVLVGGTIKYSPQEITDPLLWNEITIQTTPDSTVPIYYYIDKYALNLFPTPSADGNVISAIVTQIEPDLNQTDYTSGTIDVTNGSPTVNGTNVAWLPTFVGRFILMPDGLWYEVASVTSATQLQLVKLFEGPTTSGATYRMGQVSLIPEEGQMLPIYYAAMLYYNSVEKQEKAVLYQRLFNGTPIREGTAIEYYDGLMGLKQQYQTRTETALMPGSDLNNLPADINLYPQSIPGPGNP